jgi:hypothetical protein
VFGGLCAGLQMVLSASYTVSNYFYSNISLEAQHLSHHRALALSMRFPGQFDPAAFQPTLHNLPQDVRDITAQNIYPAAQQPRQPAGLSQLRHLRHQ